MKTFLEWMQTSFLSEIHRQTMTGNDWSSPVDWAVIEDHLRKNTCQERRRYGNCTHRKCEIGESLANIARTYDLGANTSNHEIDVMIQFIRSKTCGPHRSTGQCNHAACGYTTHLIDWLEKQQHGQQRRIA